MTVHQDGIVVHELSNDQAHLAPLAKLLIERRYDLGDRREVLAHVLAFGTVAGCLHLVRPDDLAHIEAAIEAGILAVPQDDPSWGSALGSEDPTVALDDCWTPNDVLAVTPPELEETYPWEDDPAGLEASAVAVQAPCKCHADIHRPAGRALDQVLDHEARLYAAWGSPTGDFLARLLRDEAQKVRLVTTDGHPITDPDVYLARIEVLDGDIAQDYYDRGHADGAAGIHAIVA